MWPRQKDVSGMEEVFVSRTSAVARILTAREALLREPDHAHGLTSGDKASRVEQLEQLLFDVRAGRTFDFILPTPQGDIRVFVTQD